MIGEKPTRHAGWKVTDPAPVSGFVISSQPTIIALGICPAPHRKGPSQASPAHDEPDLMSVDSLFFRFEARHQQLEAREDQSLRRSYGKRLHGVLFDTKKTGQVRRSS